MTDCEHDVKSCSRRIADWLDCHPRTGWYIALWVALVSLNAVVGYVDLLFRALA